MQAMNLIQVPLTGLNLVEASAGTGKTHTLTGLYLRLLLESSLSPEQILVVTYTKAATAELKDRIRRRLLQTREAFTGQSSNDVLVEHLLQTCPDPGRVIKQLNLAIAAFDQAAIHTIHGFCQRVLTEHALETAQTFDAELVPDQQSRLQQIADDFWRIRLLGLSDQLTDWVQNAFDTPEGLLADARQGLGKPYLQVRSAEWPEDLELMDQQLAELIGSMRTLWTEEGAEIQRFLSDGKQLKQNVYRRDWVARWVAEMQAWLHTEPPDLRGFANLKKFTQTSITAGLRAGETILESKFIDICQSVNGLIESRIEKYQAAVSCLRRQFYDYLCVELPRRQQAAGEWSYDDLLLQLEQALWGVAGERLAEILQRRYPAALVDEFQDTDPLQYRILSRIYGQGRQPVFLVGDPKQAIYSFRGADIFAYLAARSAAREQYSLDVNWRSTPQLIHALNTLFTQNPAAFLFSQIPFHSVTAAPGQIQGLVEKGDQAGPLRIWQLSCAGDTKLPEVRQLVAEATADEIARLLKLAHAGRLTLAGRPLGGGDIAVLVRRHLQAEQIANALASRGIHSVRTAQDNVFLSREAAQLERLLLALLEPRREPLLRSALATDLLGWDGAAIDRLNRDDALLGRQFEYFIGYHQRWRDTGFIRMFRQLLFEFAVEKRLLSYRDGERRLTNLYQLVELIHRHDTESRIGMEGLLKWFSRQCQDQAVSDEERQLRLESDSHLVKIVTQHASKGLQYPVVFCPFLWDESLGLRNGQNSYLFHDPETDYQAVFELGSPGFTRNQRYFKTEQLAESLRLLYVALTRAQHRCYLPWGKVKNSEHSALAWLLHPPETPAEDPLAVWQASFKRLTPDAIQQRLEALAQLAEGAISLAPLPVGQPNAQLEFALPPALGAARAFRGVLQSGPRISSFSSLVAGLAAELPDHDATALAEQAGPQEMLPSIHTFPRGAQPGTCLHSIFEQLDFTANSREELESLVTTSLTSYGIEASWTRVIAEMVEAVLAVPLNGGGLKLQDIPGRQRIIEMEFHFPVRHLEPRALETLAKQHGFAQSNELLAVFRGLNFPRIQGFMTGFIDLVIEWQGRFYLLDYKSNWLGNDLDAYAQPQLQRAMLAHHYPIQYLFYVLALHRYLGQRLADYDYDQHFGEVYYLFLRGMDPRTGNAYGVFRERPARAFIEALDRYLSAGES